MLFAVILLPSFVSCLAGTAAPGPAYGPSDHGPVLRIGLIRAIGRPTTLTVSAPGSALLAVGEGSTAAQGPAVWSFSVTSLGVTANDPDGAEVVSGPNLRVIQATRDAADLLGVNAGGRPHRYRGDLAITADKDGRLTVTNTVRVEDYLRGVVPMEMPPSAPAEGLKAQAVAARTYALKMRGRYASRGYDLTDSTDSQMYGGADAERASTDDAVAQTAGLVLFHNGAMLLADYFDDCGGTTSPGTRDGDYPPSIRDAPMDGGEDYCARGRYHTWTLRITAEELTARLRPRDRARSGTVSDVRVVDLDSSGRARTVAIVSGSSTDNMPGPSFRALLGYDRLKSTLFTVSRDADGTFVFAGRGYGHGHGMCQMGAMGLAAEPYRRNFREILAHYFPGSTVGSLSGAR